MNIEMKFGHANIVCMLEIYADAFFSTRRTWIESDIIKKRTVLENNGDIYLIPMS